MPTVPKPTKRMSVFLMRPGVGLKDAITGSRTSVDLQVGGRDARLVSDSAHGASKWVTDVQLITGKTVVAPSTSSGAVLLIDGPSSRTWAVAWGTGHHYLDGESIDYAFASGVVARSAVPDEVKSVTKKILDARARVDRTSQPAGATMRDLGVEGNGEAIGNIEAKARIPGLTVGGGQIVLRAGASLNLPLAKSAAGILADLAVLDALRSQPVITGMESVEQLVALRPKEPKVQELDKLLVRSLKSTSQDALGVAWPEERLALTGVMDSLKISGVGDRTTHHFDTVLEVDDVRNLFTATHDSAVLDQLRNMSITVHSDNPPTSAGRVSQSVSLRRWLSFEVKDGSQRYCLYDGDWYRMDDRYLAQIDARVIEILSRPAAVGLSPWPLGIDEEDYNKDEALALGGLTLDRKLISTPLHSRGGIEPCDIYVQGGILIHVKRGKSSSAVSHLLAQALVSSDALARDQYARAAWHARLGGNSG